MLRFLTRRSFMGTSSGLLAGAVIAPQMGLVPMRNAVAAQSASPQAGDTSPERILEVIRMLYEDGWDAHDPSVVFDIVADGHVYHDSITPGIGTGPQGYADLMTFYLGAFPDLNFPIRDIVIGSDAVGVRWTADATQTGDLLGIPATGKHLTVPAMAIHTFTDGKISATTVIYDTLGMLSQLGLAPATGSNPSATPEAAISFPTLLASPAGAISPDAAKEVARAFYQQLWNERRVDLVSEFVTPAFAYIDPAVPALPPGPGGYAAFVRSFESAFPDLHIDIDTVVSSGSSVAMHWVATGTQTGEFLGIPPTDLPISTEAITFLTFEGDRVATNWSVFDALGVLMQLGVIPPLGGAPAATPAA